MHRVQDYEWSGRRALEDLRGFFGNCMHFCVRMWMSCLRIQEFFRRSISNTGSNHLTRSGDSECVLRLNFS